MKRLSGWEWLQLPFAAIIILTLSQVALLILKVNGVLWGAISWWWVMSPLYLVLIAVAILAILWYISKRK